MKYQEGIVVSNKMTRTCIVSVSRRGMHKPYGKVVTSTNRYAAHDPLNCSVGDRVRMFATAPLSKTKRWCIVNVQKIGGV
jgi:small subunit ribosomal protein S17